MSRKVRIFWIVFLLILFGGGIFFGAALLTGSLKFGAEVITGCQGSRQISNFMGRPGANLVTYNLFGQEVTVNEKITSFLDGVQKEVNDAKTGYTFSNIQTYNNRSKRGGGGKSLHSYGIAIDINPGSNPQTGRGEVQTDIPQVVIDIFRKYGFVWGGEWVGERDAMHFEWYGGEVSGNFVNANNGQKITEVTTTLDNLPVPTADGSYNWTLAATHPYQIKVKARGYEENNFSLSLSCFEDRTADIVLKPLADNLPGSISGHITLRGRSPLIPATISLDGKAVGASNVTGDYIISGVTRGRHTITAKILLFPSASISTIDMVPGEAINNLDLTIGQ